MPSLGTPEIIMILLVIILLFGAKRLPDTARGLGRSLRILKSETKGLRDDDDKTVVHTEQVSPRPIETTQAPLQAPVNPVNQAQPVQAQQPVHPVQAPQVPPVPHRTETTER